MYGGRRRIFYICLRGLMMDNHETLRASYQLYIAGKNRIPIKSGNYQFGSDGYYEVGGHFYDYRSYRDLERALREDGSLVVVAEVEFVSKPLLSKLSCTAFKLRESGGHNDCTLKVGNEEFKAHRAILSDLSPAFETMLQPYQEVTVQVKDYSVKAVKALLNFAYTGYVDWTHYGDCKQEETGTAEEAFNTASVRSEHLWLDFLSHLSKPNLDKCREVSKWTNRLIEKHSGGKLKQRRQLCRLTIAPNPIIDADLEMTWLDVDERMEDDEETEEMEKIDKIETKVKELIGEIIYPYEPDDATVRISIQRQQDQHLYIDVKNRLDKWDALLIARLMPRITPPMAVFKHIILMLDSTPKLPADAPYEGSYLNPAVFSLPSNADGSGGSPVKLITQYLTLVAPLIGPSPRDVIKTAEQTVQCQVLYRVYRPALLLYFLHLVAVARALNAAAWITADGMEDGRLDEMLNFFTHTVPGFESAAPCLRVTIRNTTAWPDSLMKTSAVNSREEQLAERLYKFRRYNHNGDELKIEVRGSFGNIEDEVKGEDCLRVAEMVLRFRPDDTDE